MYAYRYLQDKYKLQPFQAAGVVGNLMQESTFNTGARNAGDGRDGSDSIGIGQWNGQRAKNLRAFGGDNFGNLDTQLDFVMHEMTGTDGKNGAGSEAYAWKQLQNAQDVHGATSAMISFERPSGWSQKNPTAGHGFDNRLSWAGEVMGMSPEEIAKASPTSSNIAPLAMAQGKANPDAGKGYDDGLISFAQNKLSPDTAPTQGAEVAERGLLEKLGLGSMPDKVLGVDSNKGLKAMGSMASLMGAQTAQQNQQAQQMGANARARRESAPPIEIAPAQSVVMQSGGLGGQSPDQIEELKKRMMLARLLGNGGGGLLG
jgi:hypothetical protein